VSARAALPFLPLAFLACSETLRDPPPATGAAGAPAPSAYASAEPPASTGGGLVPGSAAASGLGPAGGGGSGSTGGSGGTGGTGGGGAASGPTGGAGTGGGGTAGRASMFQAPPWRSEGSWRFVELQAQAIGMSDAGDRVLQADGTLWIDGGVGPGTMVRTVDVPIALSGDGRTVAGDSPSQSPCPMPTIWTRTSLVNWPVPIDVVGTSDDGGVVVGTTANGCMDPPRAFVLALGAFVLNQPAASIDPFPGDDATAALAVSGDGSQVIGFSSMSAAGTGRLFSWQVGVKTPLHTTPIRRPVRVLTSTDGRVVAGTFPDAAGALTGFVAGAPGSAAGPTAALAILPKLASRGQNLVVGLSANGAVVLLLGSNAPSTPPNPATQDGLPFTWSATAGPAALAVPPTVMAFESAVMTPDASLIVGTPSSPPSAPPVAWDSQRTPRFLFSDAPQFVQSCEPVVTSLSSDGGTLAGVCFGLAINGFIARSP
jgi:hypothetical protein